MVSVVIHARTIDFASLRTAADRIMSRMNTVIQLLSWDANRSSRSADALLLIHRLANDLVNFARALEGLAPDSLSAAGSNIVELPDGPMKTALSSITGLLHKPWDKWRPEQRLRLAQQLLDACELALELLQVRSIASAETATVSRKRLAIVIIILGALFAGGWQAYTSLISPRHYAQRMKDLAVIRTALDKYRQVRGAYPVSSSNGERWNGIGWDGVPGDWIPGLVPDFISALPRDPNSAENPFQQYVYRSDGKDYKLLVLGPDDCEYVARTHPDMEDLPRNVYKYKELAAKKITLPTPIRICRAYGYWTTGAADW